MRKHRLNLDSLNVDSFGTEPVDAGGCVCDHPPCICTAGDDCTTGK